MERIDTIPKIKIIRGDITKIEVDAIVNAANERLLGGGGVDGAIHQAAGPELLEACKLIGGCPTGEARITLGYNLPAEWVIHTVGSIWKGGTFGEEVYLACCYTSVFSLAITQGIKSIAFPSISTGVYGFPVSIACEIALGSMIEHLRVNERMDEVFIVCFDAHTEVAYLDAYKKLPEVIKLIDGWKKT